MSLFDLPSFRGASRNRTGDEGFADPRLTSWLRRLFNTLVYYSRLLIEKQHYFKKTFVDTICQVCDNNKVINYVMT